MWFLVEDDDDFEKTNASWPLDDFFISFMRWIWFLVVKILAVPMFARLSFSSYWMKTILWPLCLLSLSSYWIKKPSYGQRECVFSSRCRLKLQITSNTWTVSFFILNRKTSYGQRECDFSSRCRLKLLITLNTWTVSLLKWFLKSSSSSNLTNAGQYLCCGAPRGKEDWTWENFLLGIFLTSMFGFDSNIRWNGLAMMLLIAHGSQSETSSPS